MSLWIRSGILTIFSITRLHNIFQKCGLESREEIYTLDNPDTRIDLNRTVVVGIQHVLTTALAMNKLNEIKSLNEIMDLREAMLRDLRNLGCYYCFDVHVVVGRKT